MTEHDIVIISGEALPDWRLRLQPESGNSRYSDSGGTTVSADLKPVHFTTDLGLHIQEEFDRAGICRRVTSGWWRRSTSPTS